jgi:hypothetical protein
MRSQASREVDQSFESPRALDPRVDGPARSASPAATPLVRTVGAHLRGSLRSSLPSVAPVLTSPGRDRPPSPFQSRPLCLGTSAATGVASPWWLGSFPSVSPTMVADAFVVVNRIQHPLHWASIAWWIQQGFSDDLYAGDHLLERRTPAGDRMGTTGPHFRERLLAVARSCLDISVQPNYSQISEEKAHNFSRGRVSMISAFSRCHASSFAYW